MNEICECCGKEFKAGELKINDFGFCVCNDCFKKKEYELNPKDETILFCLFEAKH